jgi:hypothetical protein
MKRKLFKLLIFAVLGTVGLGFYRGWFSLSTQSPTPTTHEIDIKLTVDPDKIKADAEAVKEKASGLTHEAAPPASQ